MGLVQWATSAWGQRVPIHAAWGLIWLAMIAGLGFIVVHAIYVAFVAPPKTFARRAADAATAGIPNRVPRHSLAARLFHWIMAAAMLALLFTAFLPKLGVQLNWVTWHWIAGLVLTASVLFHIFHTTFVLDWRSIWPDAIDLRDARHRFRRFWGKPAPLPERAGKYPLDNKLYHLIIVITGLSAIATGLFMMKRVETGIFVRNPYLFSDLTWGWMYVLHGLAGISLIALIAVHVYMGLRPEKLAITNGMVRGWMDKDFYLEEHDPERWVVTSNGK